MRSLRVFYGNGNNFTRVPKELGQLAVLEKLNLADNKIQGTIPDEYARGMLELRELDLSSNAVSGSIPVEFYRLQRLQNLRLNSNSLTGLIPAELGLMMELEQIEVSHVRIRTDNLIEQQRVI